MDLRKSRGDRPVTWPDRLRGTTRRTRRTLLAGVAAVAVLAGAGTWSATASGDEPPVERVDRTFAMPGAKIDASYFTSGPRSAKRPVVLLGHGFGGDKDDMRAQAQSLARQGYAALTWSARGFGDSTGEIGLNDPEHEVADVSRLIDWLARRPEVRLDGGGDPRVGITGASYGGAIALLAAGHDDRVDAIAPRMTYWNLADSLFPDGVFKKLWAGVFFGSGSPQGGCGRFEAEVCEMYERVAVSGEPDRAARRLLEARSPSAVGDRIKVPALIAQGQADSLFPLGQADAMAKAIRANGAPVSVDWFAGGHDGGDPETARLDARTAAWFDRHLKGDKGVDAGPAFRITESGGVDSTDGTVRTRGATGASYPGLRSGAREVALDAGEKRFENPAGAGPPSISSVPSLGGGLSQLSSLGVGGLNVDFPGQHARFDSRPLTSPLRVTGSPTAKVRVKSEGDADAVLFAKVYDVGPDGRATLPSQLVSSVRVSGAQRGRTVEIRLPAVDHEVEAGHRLRLVLATTDLGYASPAEPGSYTASLAGGLSVPTADGVSTEAAPLPAWVWGLPLAGAAAAVLLVTVRRRAPAPAPEPELAEVPLQITGLTKRYAKSEGRYAVRDLSFRVEKGQVLGLLGPNGAGKTTALRMLMGLVTPDAGEIRLYGHAVRPGAPVLSRVGSFVEGAGFLPHLSGRANLGLYWAATGRPAEDARMDDALEIAGLGDAVQRAVRTYSQGMRQRLAIAQAMLGMPDLLILDEPTNGLDPPQIREMREVMIRYAAQGRTVIVSSHLLAEVEQSCTHLVVMDRGRLVQAGAVKEITGSGETLLVGVDGPPLGDAELGKVAGLPGVLSAVRADDGLLVRLSGASPSQLLAELVGMGIPVNGFAPHRRLEDAFLTLIEGETS
ncbi:ABC-2 type transport system ATP-binding protein [Streptomyces sp. WMMB 714]|uniref:alpha/beta fold hydrolase n=1 Tax=Streptomyces sp. WMMB 714 TaxID=1286822 RepID=UPI0005F7835C|nr:alpha/beta fold hydrolase [Streptomyces sp. WMMB 714]SCK06522.1 ABC-2 type transport system ATP-binding protein [Streptomyces sp. WMMB 714]